MGGATIPLPALHTNPIEPPVSPLQAYAQVLGIKNQQQQQQMAQQEAPLRMQALQQQVQLGQQQVQTGQQDIATRKALNDAYRDSVTTDANGQPTVDADKLAKGLAQGPAAWKTPEVLQGVTEFQKGRIGLQSAMTDLQTKQADMLGSAASAVKAAGYDPTLAHALLDTLPQSPQLAQIRAQIDNPQTLKQLIDSAIQNSPNQQKLANELAVANIRANTPEAQEMNSWLQKNPGKTAADYQQFKVDQGVQAAVQKDTDPRVQRAKIDVASAEGRARASIEASQGHGVTMIEPDPNHPGAGIVRYLTPGAAVAAGSQTAAGVNALNTPTSSQRTAAGRADTVISMAPEVLKRIDDLAPKIGPISGRWNEFMQGKIGADDPDFSGLRSDLLMMSSAVALAHAQGRLPENLREEFDSAINAPKQTAANLKSTINAMIPWLQKVKDQGSPNNSPNQGSASNTPPPPPKVGDVVRGYRFKGGDAQVQSNWEKVAK